jgi:Ser/Thr protein kinase RdoA (MazF antagonist)
MRERAAGWTAPATEFAVEWLRANAPSTPSATSICHGDAGPGNFLFEGARVTAMLDWEFAHVGDPHDDLAWVAVRTPLLGQLDLADAYAAWEATTGLTIEPARVEYYRVLVLTRMIISCDAAVAWKNGVVDESILTHSILRPWLAGAILRGIEFAGGGSPEIDHLASMAAKDLSESEHGALAAMIPALVPFAV